jgi:hypothetical protein
VAKVIRAKRWGGTGLGRGENFRSKPGQVTTSRSQEARFLGRRTGPRLGSGRNSRRDCEVNIAACTA